VNSRRIRLTDPTDVSLIKAIDRHQTAPVLIASWYWARQINGLDSNVDGLEADLGVLGSTGNKPQRKGIKRIVGPSTA
jgi:hypothetical protein